MDRYCIISAINCTYKSIQAPDWVRLTCSSAGGSLKGEGLRDSAERGLMQPRSNAGEDFQSEAPSGVHRRQEVA